MRIVIVGLCVLAASPLCAEVEVRVADNRVSLHAVSAPLSEILNSLARQTGMRLSCDVPCPRQALTATLENRTPGEAVLSLLEGLGVNYALVMDRSGARVEQLLILGTAAAEAPPAAPIRPGPAQQDPQALSQAEVDAAWEEDVGDDELPVDDAETEGKGAQGAQGAAKAPPAGAAGAAVPHPPDYPSSSFSPRLPVPVPAPAPTPEAPKNQ